MSSQTPQPPAAAATNSTPSPAPPGPIGLTGSESAAHQSLHKPTTATSTISSTAAVHSPYSLSHGHTHQPSPSGSSSLHKAEPSPSPSLANLHSNHSLPRSLGAQHGLGSAPPRATPVAAPSPTSVGPSSNGLLPGSGAGTGAGAAAASAANSAAFRPLNVRDALQYLDRVKQQFATEYDGTHIPQP